MLEPMTSAEESASPRSSSDRLAASTELLTAVRAASPRWWRPDLDCRTASRSRRRTTSRAREQLRRLLVSWRSQGLMAEMNRRLRHDHDLARAIVEPTCNTWVTGNGWIRCKARGCQRWRDARSREVSACPSSSRTCQRNWRPNPLGDEAVQAVDGFWTHPCLEESS